MPARGSWEQVFGPYLPIMNETASNERAPQPAKSDDAARAVPRARGRGSVS